MPRRKLPDELKAAISKLPSKEKDKLLFRLIPKDEALMQKLAFQLLEDTGSKEERRAELREEIEHLLNRVATHFYSPGYLLLDLRAVSGAITRHVKTTKDKYGEIELNFFMLNYALEMMGDEVKPFSARRSRTFNTYVIKRAIKLQKLLGKLHEDYRLDFEADMKTLATFLRADPQLMEKAKQLGLDVEALGDGVIPD
ncbi:MAG: hypothetical protein GVY26_04260 [Bacteroidetes bacterium]|jgi:hypothetical protein|nr:hypothetical protein [Bacteroidota bacterium]